MRQNVIAAHLFSLDPALIAFLDCEASSLGRASYPIEIGWCLADTGKTGSCLIRPSPGWTDWDPAAEAVHGITRARIFAEGVPPETAAVQLTDACGGRVLFADSSKDAEWIDLLFHEAKLPPPNVAEFDRLLEQIIRPEPDPPAGGDRLRVELERVTLQHQMIGIAYAYAMKVAPKTHRAAADAFHLFTVYQRALELMPIKGLHTTGQA